MSRAEVQRKVRVTAAMIDAAPRTPGSSGRGQRGPDGPGRRRSAAPRTVHPRPAAGPCAGPARAGIPGHSPHRGHSGSPGTRLGRLHAVGARGEGLATVPPHRTSATRKRDYLRRGTSASRLEPGSRPPPPGQRPARPLRNWSGHFTAALPVAGIVPVCAAIRNGFLTETPPRKIAAYYCPGHIASCRKCSL